MHIEQYTNIEAIAALLLILGGAWLLYRLLPGQRTAPVLRTFSEAEIRAYDRQLPKYFVVSAIALALGGLHAVIKSLPPIFDWLATAGHAGVFARDLSNSHLIIVLGGTIAATALGWYVLPRVARRPLASPALASWSFWCTVVGAAGFYLSLLILGIVMSAMAHQGIDYEAAKLTLGAWRTVPIAASASIMGLGYWTFVANVWLTVWQARRVADPQPHGHLLKFFAVGALGLFIGTVQGVIQVLPDNETWLQAAGPAGEFIDPISHAHVNLVLGTLCFVAGLLFYETGLPVPQPRRRRVEQFIFWVLAPGAMLFYLAFLILGLIEGGMVVDQNLPYDVVVQRMGLWQTVPLMVAGIIMLAGFWGLLATMVARFGRGPERQLPGAPLIVAAAVVLFIGTTQGLMQLLPWVKDWMVHADDGGDAIANAHAQLNMIGGVLLAVIGLAAMHSEALLGARMPAALLRRVLRFVVTGIGIYYVSALATAIIMGSALIGGASTAVAAWEAEPLGPLGIALGAAIYGIGFAFFARFTWQATAETRLAGWHSFQAIMARYDSPHTPWAGRIPAAYYLGAEVAGAIAGFPGLGWLLSGRALVGLTSISLGPVIAWAIIPTLMSPFGDGVLVPLGVWPFLSYIALSTITSTALLGWRLRVARQARQRAPAKAAAPAAVPAPVGER